jgi:hypothetical protein
MFAESRLRVQHTIMHACVRIFLYEYNYIRKHGTVCTFNYLEPQQRKEGHIFHTSSCHASGLVALVDGGRLGIERIIMHCVPISQAGLLAHHEDWRAER